MSQHHQRIKNDPRWKTARAACLARDDYQCVSCGEVDDLQADHILPLASNPDLAFELDNLQTLCGPCNREKGNTQPTTTRNQWVNPKYSELIPIVGF